MTDVETLEGAGITETEFHDRVESLQEEILELCNAEDHGGIIICGIVSALAVQIYDLCVSNGVDFKDALKQVNSDLKEHIKNIQENEANEDVEEEQGNTEEIQLTH